MIQIILTIHALKQYKKRTKSTKDMSDIRKELKQLFIDLTESFEYEGYTIKHGLTYNLSSSIQWGNKKIIYSISDNCFTLLTYYENNPHGTQLWKKEQQKKINKQLRSHHQKNKH